MGAGAMPAADVTNVVMTCSGQSYRVGGTITGLAASGMVLANGSDTLNVASGASSFTMPRPVASGGGDDVTVQSSPAGETCTVTSGGTGNGGTAHMSNINVGCVAGDYTRSATINGPAP